MPWDSSLSTGIDKVDGQHMALVEKIEEFLVACSDHDGHHGINSMLNFMESYVILHFNDEETLQIECSYPGYKRHKALHGYFIQDFTELKDRIDTEGITPEITDDASKILLDWVMQHISDEDIVFAKHYVQVMNK